MTDTSTWLLPPHKPADGAPEGPRGSKHEWQCAASRVAGYWQPMPNGLVHCNRCGWIGVEPENPRKVMLGYATPALSRQHIREAAQVVLDEGHFEQVKAWATTAVELLDELESTEDRLRLTEVRLDECRVAREAGY